MNLYFLKHDLYVAWAYNHEGYMLIDSCVGEYGAYYRHCYLYYTEMEAIHLHVNRFHELNLSFEEIETEMEEWKNEK